MVRGITFYDLIDHFMVEDRMGEGEKYFTKNDTYLDSEIIQTFVRSETLRNAVLPKIASVFNISDFRLSHIVIEVFKVAEFEFLVDFSPRCVYMGKVRKMRF